MKTRDKWLQQVSRHFTRQTGFDVEVYFDERSQSTRLDIMTYWGLYPPPGVTVKNLSELRGEGWVLPEILKINPALPDKQWKLEVFNAATKTLRSPHSVAFMAKHPKPTPRPIDEYRRPVPQSTQVATA